MRIHTVILTRDRPETLARCVDTALSTLRANDTLTVLDDSCEVISYANAAVLAQAARHSIAPISHLRAGQLHNVIARATGGPGTVWQTKTAPRDIAPLRNLTLLLSASVDAQTTILVDDDMRYFDLEATHHTLDAHSRLSASMVVGAEIGGMTEQDTVTRLSDAMRRLQAQANTATLSAEELFRVPPNFASDETVPCGCLSAGYMAFRLPVTSLFAFPPGYNEDWLWCLLHGASGKAHVLRTDQVVMHEPPTLRQPLRDDILFELAGDLVLDSLVECCDRMPRPPQSVLEALVDCTPDPLVMPSVRAESIVKQAQELSENQHGRSLTNLESYGLCVLRDMLHSGELAIDSRRMLRAWSADAVAKHRAFATTLGAVTLRCAIGAALKEGRK